ncbi:MAG: cytochrome c oxidase subunit [Actinomycetota bacterium]|nr:cytochrome c oxidase subunit [Actinomycetota bacterium]
MTATLTDPIGLELPPVPVPGRRNVLLVGALLAAAAGTALVGALLAGYFNARDVAKAAHHPWPPKGEVMPSVALVVDYLGLLLSAFTAHWTLAAIKIDDRRQAYLAVAATVGFGLLFVNGMTFCWMRLGAGATSSTWATHVYAVTVVHVLIVIVAIAVFVVAGFRVFGGQFSPRHNEPLVAAVVFWDFAVAAGVVIWWFLFFLQRHIPK